MDSGLVERGACVRPGVATDIDDIIAGIYRAAAGDVPWVRPLGDIVERFHCWGVQVFGQRPVDGSMVFTHGAGFPAESMLHYVSRYHHDDPRTLLLAPLGVGEWWHCHEHFDDRFVARHPLYQELLLPYGARYSSAVKLIQDDDLLVVMAVGRGPAEGPLRDEELVQVRRLGIHVRTALLLWRMQSRARRHAVAGEAILARLTQPVLLVDDSLQIHYRNAAADAFLRGRRGVADHAGRLACALPSAQGELMIGVGRLMLCSASPDRGAARVDRVAVRTNAREQGPVLVLTRLEAAATMAAFGRRDIALVLVHDPAQRQTPDPLLVATAFALTPAEAGVACQVAAGRSPREIAVDSGVSVHTVRTQLSHAFAKVGVTRQAELAAAFARLTGL